jgi:hypothetical protein
METVSFSETLEKFHQYTRCHITENRTLHSDCRDKFKSNNLLQARPDVQGALALLTLCVLPLNHFALLRYLVTGASLYQAEKAEMLNSKLLTTMGIKTIFIWVVTPCSLVPQLLRNLLPPSSG